MSSIRALLQDVPLPKMIRARQSFDATKIQDIPAALHERLAAPGFADSVKPGMRIAITCGSRGIDNYPLIIKELAALCKTRGASPFIIPAMGSHGGATAEGQRLICESLGVTEQYCGCPILSSMEVKEIGRTEDGLGVLIDKHAAQADGIIVINRIKPHTGFRGPHESGLMKMLVIGLGKQQGAARCHQAGYREMNRLLSSIGGAIARQAPILFAVGLVENAYDATCTIAVMPPEEIAVQEPDLLFEARRRMARLLPGRADVLVVGRIGKNISGGGMDSNVTGRSSSPYFGEGNFVAAKIAALDLTDESHGNMHGVGGADVICKRIFEKGSLEHTYPNSITSTTLKADALPVMMPDDKLTFQCALKTCNCPDIARPHLVLIKDTLAISEIFISEAMREMCAGIEGLRPLGEPEELRFDGQGNLLTPW